MLRDFPDSVSDGKAGPDHPDVVVDRCLDLVEDIQDVHLGVLKVFFGAFGRYLRHAFLGEKELGERCRFQCDSGDDQQQHAGPKFPPQDLLA